MTWNIGGAPSCVHAALYHVNGMVMVVYCSNIVHSGTGETTSVDFSWYSWKKVSEEAIGNARVSVLQITRVVPHILQHHLLVLFFEY